MSMDNRKRRKEGVLHTPSLEDLQTSPKRVRVQAQRKFAQGSQPNSPAPTPIKDSRELRERSGSTDTRTRNYVQGSGLPISTDIVEVPFRPKTEDFLTFLCFRGTSLFPPGLEHFNTPQFVETAGDSRSQSPARDDRIRIYNKKKLEPSTRELSKENVRKNLEAKTDSSEDQQQMQRVTRSTVSNPLESSNIIKRRRRRSKKLIVKKAILLKKKARTLQLQEGNGTVLGLTSVASNKGVALTRASSLVHKYRVSVRRKALARQKARLGKLTAIRPKPVLNRMLQRLGDSISHDDTPKTRITRSKSDTREEQDEDLFGEEDIHAQEGTTEIEENTPDSLSIKENVFELSPPTLRVLRKKIDKKKVVQKVLRATRRDTQAPPSVEFSSPSPDSSPPSSNNVSPDQPVYKRLRRNVLQETEISSEHSESVSTVSLRERRKSRESQENETQSSVRETRRTRDGSQEVKLRVSLRENRRSIDTTNNQSIGTDITIRESRKFKDKSKTEITQNKPNSNSNFEKDSALTLRKETSVRKSRSNSFDKDLGVIPFNEVKQNQRNNVNKLDPTCESQNDSLNSSFSEETTSELTLTKEIVHEKDVFVQLSPLDEAKIATRSRLGRRSHEGDQEDDCNASTNAKTLPRSRPSRRIKEIAAEYVEQTGKKLVGEVTRQNRSRHIKQFDDDDDDGVDKDNDNQDNGAKSVGSFLDHNVDCQDKTKEEFKQDLEQKEQVLDKNPTKENILPYVEKKVPSISIRRTRNSDKEEVKYEVETNYHSNNCLNSPPQSPRLAAVADVRKTKKDQEAGTRITRRGSMDQTHKLKEGKKVFKQFEKQGSMDQLYNTSTIWQLSDMASKRSTRRDIRGSDENILTSISDTEMKETTTRSQGELRMTENKDEIKDLVPGAEEKASLVGTRRSRSSLLSGKFNVDKDEMQIKIRDDNKVRQSKTADMLENVPCEDMNKSGNFLSVKACEKSKMSDKKLENPSQKLKFDGDIESGAKAGASGKQIGSRSRRTVSQDRKVYTDLEKGSVLAKSIEYEENTFDVEGKEYEIRQKRSSRSNSTEIRPANNSDIDRKVPVAPNRRKSIGSRRRSSNHDEAKLKEMLEIVARGFEKEIDENHYAKIEKDLTDVNKSPDKLLTNKTVEKDDLESRTNKKDLKVTSEESDNLSPAEKKSLGIKKLFIDDDKSSGGNKLLIDDKSFDDKSFDDKSFDDNKSKDENKSTGAISSDYIKSISDNKSSDNKSNDNKSRDSRSSENVASDDKSSDDKLSDNKSSDNKSSSDSRSLSDSKLLIQDKTISGNRSGLKVQENKSVPILVSTSVSPSVSQSGSPSPSRRNPNGKKLSDVVRNLQKKQAESPCSKFVPGEKPSFLKELNSRNSADKSRQVSLPLSGCVTSQSTESSQAPTTLHSVVSQSEISDQALPSAAADSNVSLKLPIQKSTPTSTLSRKDALATGATQVDKSSENDKSSISKDTQSHKAEKVQTPMPIFTPRTGSRQSSLKNIKAAIKSSENVLPVVVPKFQNSAEQLNMQTVKESQIDVSSKVMSNEVGNTSSSSSSTNFAASVFYSSTSSSSAPAPWHPKPPIDAPSPLGSVTSKPISNDTSFLSVANISSDTVSISATKAGNTKVNTPSTRSKPVSTNPNLLSATNISSDAVSISAAKNTSTKLNTPATRSNTVTITKSNKRSKSKKGTVADTNFVEMSKSVTAKSLSKANLSNTESSVTSNSHQIPSKAANRKSSKSSSSSKTNVSNVQDSISNTASHPSKLIGTSGSSNNNLPAILPKIDQMSTAVPGNIQPNSFDIAGSTPKSLANPNASITNVEISNTVLSTSKSTYPQNIRNLQQGIEPVTHPSKSTLSAAAQLGAANELIIPKPKTILRKEQGSLSRSQSPSVKDQANMNELGSELLSGVPVSRITHKSHAKALERTQSPVSAKSMQKQLHIAPKPAKNSGTSLTSNQTTTGVSGQLPLAILPHAANIKSSVKPVQIAPKPSNTQQSVTISTQLQQQQQQQQQHAGAGIPSIGHIVPQASGGVQQQGIMASGAAVTMQQLINMQQQQQQQAMQTFTGIPGAMAPSVQAVITQTGGAVTFAQTQVGTPSSPAKILTQPMLVTSSVAGCIPAPYAYGITAQPLAHSQLSGGVGTVTRVLAPTLVGKVTTKQQQHMSVMTTPRVTAPQFVAIAPPTAIQQQQSMVSMQQQSQQQQVTVPQSTQQQAAAAQLVAVNMLPVGCTAITNVATQGVSALPQTSQASVVPGYLPTQVTNYAPLQNTNASIAPSQVTNYTPMQIPNASVAQTQVTNYTPLQNANASVSQTQVTNYTPLQNANESVAQTQVTNYAQLQNANASVAQTQVTNYTQLQNTTVSVAPTQVTNYTALETAASTVAPMQVTNYTSLSTAGFTAVGHSHNTAGLTQNTTGRTKGRGKAPTLQPHSSTSDTNSNIVSQAVTSDTGEKLALKTSLVTISSGSMNTTSSYTMAGGKSEDVSLIPSNMSVVPPIPVTTNTTTAISSSKSSSNVNKKQALSNNPTSVSNASYHSSQAFSSASTRELQNSNTQKEFLIKSGVSVSNVAVTTRKGEVTEQSDTSGDSNPLNQRKLIPSSNTIESIKAISNSNIKPAYSTNAEPNTGNFTPKQKSLDTSNSSISKNSVPPLSKMAFSELTTSIPPTTVQQGLLTPLPVTAHQPSLATSKSQSKSSVTITSIPNQPSSEMTAIPKGGVSTVVSQQSVTSSNSSSSSSSSSIDKLSGSISIVHYDNLAKLTRRSAGVSAQTALVNASVNTNTNKSRAAVSRIQNINGKAPEFERIGRKKVEKKEPVYKRTLLKTKSEEDKKTTGAFSPLHESSVYAFEPEVDNPLEESPFSQRIKKVHTSPGTSPIKPSNTLKPPQQQQQQQPQHQQQPQVASISNSISNVNRPVNRITPSKGTVPRPMTAKQLPGHGRSRQLIASQKGSNQSVARLPPGSIPSAGSPTVLSSKSQQQGTSLVGSTNAVGMSPLQGSSSGPGSAMRCPQGVPAVASAATVPLHGLPVQVTGTSGGPGPPPSLHTQPLSEIVTCSTGVTATTAMSKTPEKQSPITAPSPKSNSNTNTIPATNPKLIAQTRSSSDKKEGQTSLMNSPAVVKNKPIQNTSSEMFIQSEQEKVSVSSISKSTCNDTSCSSSNTSSTNTIAESTPIIKKNVSSSSIAIQCDIGDGDEGNHASVGVSTGMGTQTEGRPFPLPPNASPFYYLPLAMAALGEKLPAQLVQQMLEKTKGLVGAAEAGLILQQAAQLAQQHAASPGTTPPLAASTAVKPLISKDSVVSTLAAQIRANNKMQQETNQSVAVGSSSGTSTDPDLENSASSMTDNSIIDSIVGTSSSTSKTGVLQPDLSDIAEKTTTKLKQKQELGMKSNNSVNKTLDAEESESKETSITPVKKSSVTPVRKSKGTPVKKVSGTPDKNTNITPARNTSITPVRNTSITPVKRTSITPVKKENEDLSHKPQVITPQSITKESKDTPEKKTPIKNSRSKSKESDSSRSVDEDSASGGRRRSGRSTTLAATKATESDMKEIDVLKRSRRAKRVAVAMAKEEGWSSSSDAPLSPQMSPETLRGWPPPRLTSPTPSQSSEGTTSSTPSNRSNRFGSSRSRRQSPASNSEMKRVGKSSSKESLSSGFGSNFSGPSVPPGISDTYGITSGYAENLVRAPSFFPSEEEFTDPLEYIEKIRPEAEKFGLCRIVPPSNFKPECRVNDDMRFTTYNQYIHKMMQRWGPNVRTLMAIRKILAKQNIELNSNPLIGGMELDLVRLYEVVESLGGLMQVIEKELWGKVADICRIPKSAQDRLTKLDTIYCKYLLPYATLSTDEHEKLLSSVDAAHKRFIEGGYRISKKGPGASNSSEDEDEEESLDCIVKGKSTALSTFYRIARNTNMQWQPDPNNMKIDERYWEITTEAKRHVCVLSASIDTSEHGYGFPSQKSSPLAKHPWNLKNLCQNSNSVLRSMGTIVGVTAPTLHVGMLFSTVCWYRDPHSLPWIEYLHTGASKIWYGVAASQEEQLHSALKKLVPDFIKDSTVWLPSDTAMVPPGDLVSEGVRVCRVVQEPGQFVVVFPGAFTSSVCTGYLISESAFFARPQYFDRAKESFATLHKCCEPSMFSLERLVLSVATDPRAGLDALLRARDLVIQVITKEKQSRISLEEIGLTANERLSTPDSHRKKKSRFIEDEEENMCEICRQNLYVSLVTNSSEEAVYCLEHAIEILSKSPSQLEFCKLMYTYSVSELEDAESQMNERIQEYLSDLDK